VNESFLDSATLRENVVSLARNIGYVPRSRACAKAEVSFSVTIADQQTSTLDLEAGLVCVGSANDSNYIFSIPESVVTTVDSNRNATFSNINIYQGTFLRKSFLVDGSLDQRFILDNPYIDSSTIVVRIRDSVNDVSEGREYQVADNILKVDSTSEMYLLQEVQDEKYELLFGDGFFGKKLATGNVIDVSYIITDGKDGNGAANFSFSGRFKDDQGKIEVPTNAITITTNQNAMNGSDIESVDSIKYFAPRIYSSQHRAVTARDYEAIIQNIYPNTESVSVVGGEELSPPQFGNVVISIKPKNGDYISDFDRSNILSKLKQYSLSGINQKIIDLKVLYVEIDSAVYYNTTQVTNVNDLKARISNTLTTYRGSNINKFGGRFKYSKICQIIDSVDDAVTSNITRVIIRRNLKSLIDQSAQYELCFGNQFHYNKEGFNIKSTGFKIAGSNEVYYFTDVPKENGMGTISIVRDSSEDGTYKVITKSAGTVDYTKGEIIINTVNITSTVEPNNVVEIQAIPESNDIVGLTDLYLDFAVSKSTINMIKDTITSGEQISGIGYKSTSSYLNGELKRI